MSVRVVVYAEGSRETGDSAFSSLPPGHELPETTLGPAHWLIRRIAGDRELRFDVPLPLRGRRVRGSDLRHPRNVRQLATWASPETEPQLAVFFVDSDGDPSILRKLELELESRSRRRPPAVVAVPIQEFEAWLICDVAVLRKIAGSGDATKDPESMSPGEAKGVLESRLSTSGSDIRAQRAQKTAIVRSMDLDAVSKRSRSFEQFRKALLRALAD